MLDIRKIRENPAEVERAIRRKGAAADIGAILKLDETRRALVAEIDSIRGRQNKTSEAIPGLSGKERENMLAELKKMKEMLTSKEFEFSRIDEDLNLALMQLPNPPLADVPDGQDERDNVVSREAGERPQFDFTPKDYLALAQSLGIIDIPRAGKVSGSRFGYLKGDTVLLEFALVNFGLRILTDKDALSKIVKKAELDLDPAPFIPIVPPVLIRPEMLGRMGYLKKTKAGWENEEVYFMRDDELVLVGTSEQSVGPMHADEIFAENDLPKRYVGFSSCFRREAGSYGKDTKGIIRVHQFDKLEMFSYVKPEDSVKEHKFLLACEEHIMEQLKLAYRVINICAGDLGDPAAAKYDVEAWMPGQADGAGQYRETHSTSNTTDFQARRLNIRYRKPDEGIDFVHMLNGTAIAVGRMIIAILENYQTKDGKIRIPDVLKDLIGKDVIG